MDKKSLFSIGKLSRLTGVHIQSLRYYEELGILKPAYIDPDSLYRYYTFAHMRIVEAIQYCADLDIPLKQFKDFVLEKEKEIDYAKLISYGKEITYQKMRRLKSRLHFLENVQEEINHAEICYAKKIVSCYMKEKICWTMPYNGTQSSPDFHSAIYRLISDIENNGFHAGYNHGQFLLCKGNRRESYIFIDVRETDRSLENFPQIAHLPAGDYLCMVSKESQIERVHEIFPDLFEMAYDKIVISVEMFNEKFNYSTPIYETRCLLPQK